MCLVFVSQYCSVLLFWVIVPCYCYVFLFRTTVPSHCSRLHERSVLWEKYGSRYYFVFNRRRFLEEMRVKLIHICMNI